MDIFQKIIDKIDDHMIDYYTIISDVDLLSIIKNKLSTITDENHIILEFLIKDINDNKIIDQFCVGGIFAVETANIHDCQLVDINLILLIAMIMEVMNYYQYRNWYKYAADLLLPEINIEAITHYIRIASWYGLEDEIIKYSGMIGLSVETKI